MKKTMGNQGIKGNKSNQSNQASQGKLENQNDNEI